MRITVRIDDDDREQTFSMGPPRIPLDKALSVAAALEDEEILEKLRWENPLED